MPQEVIKFDYDSRALLTRASARWMCSKDYFLEFLPLSLSLSLFSFLFRFMTINLEQRVQLHEQTGNTLLSNSIFLSEALGLMLDIVSRRRENWPIAFK